MSFIQRNTFNDPSFTPFFRFLEDFDSYTNGSSTRRTAAVPTWQPKFDIRETAEAYELHGELPGLAKENVKIEFVEPQTLLIGGKVERSYTSGTPPAGLIEGNATPNAIADDDSHSNHSHKATVEDEDQAKAQEAGTVTPAKKPAASPTRKQPTDKAKYWLSERSIGEFSRSFYFPTRVDQDAVSANLKDGLLSVIVPKAKKHEARRISVL